MLASKVEINSERRHTSKGHNKVYKSLSSQRNANKLRNVRGNGRDAPRKTPHLRLGDQSKSIEKDTMLRRGGGGGGEISLRLSSLRHAYETGRWKPTDIMSYVFENIRDSERSGKTGAVFTRVPSEDALLETARSIESDRRPDERSPLYGIPFVVKDNIDVSGHVTSNGLPASFGFEEETETAPVVRALLDAGAMFVGKTNMGTSSSVSFFSFASKGRRRRGDLR